MNIIRPRIASSPAHFISKDIGGNNDIVYWYIILLNNYLIIE